MPGLADRFRSLLANEPYSSNMDVRLLSIAEGEALLEMEIGAGLINIHGTCHGGAIFTLADLAFGAAGIYGGAVLTVASDLHFMRPALHGDMVRAAATQLSRTKRTGLFQVVVSEERRGVLAAGTFKGQWIAAAADPRNTTSQVARETLP